MKIKRNQGVIGVDVGVAIIVFMMFTGIITMLFYNSSMSTIATQRKATATDIAVKIIEKIKIMDYSEFISTTEEEFINNYSTIIPEGYNLESVSVSEAKAPDLLREFTVKVTYNFKDKKETVEIKTLKSYL